MTNYTLLAFPNLLPPDPSLCVAAEQLNLWTLYLIQRLITFKILILFVYALNNFVTHGQLLLLRLLHGDQPCSLVLSAFYCLPLKIIWMCVSTGLSTTLFMILLERAFVILSQQPYPRGVWFLIFAEICAMVTLTCWALSTELVYDFQVLHCLEDTPTIIPMMNVLSSFLIVIDTTTLISAILLVFYCRWRVKKRVITSLHYSYSLRYSEMVLQAFLPIIIFHTCMIYVFNVLGIIQRSFISQIDYVTRKSLQGLFNVLPYYALVCPILYVWVLGKLRKRFERGKISRQVIFQLSPG
ncbi:unnamed protein product, partial [Mesorhabditis belari]|uniref:Uncharacterized protein n=1 Tax=Mesorhabditis belari TaxID=2138241 RepID=A0AAF3FQQ0_9BILA